MTNANVDGVVADGTGESVGELAVAQQQAQETALAAAWEAFKAQPLDAVMAVKLNAVCAWHAVEMTVLWDAVIFARRRGLGVWMNRATPYFLAEYGPIAVNERALRRAIQSLTDQGFLEQWGMPKSMPKQYMLNWPVLHDALSRISPLTPGLRESLAVVA